MEYGMEDFWYAMKMEWKKISSMEYEKIVFNSIPYHALAGCAAIEIISSHKKKKIASDNFPKIVLFA